MAELVPVFLISYLIGSLSFAWLAGRLKGVDLRLEGSGTLGARNVKRVIGKGPAFAVLALDVLKGVAGVTAAVHISGHPSSPMVGWLGLVCGHGWSLFLKFRGGKGLASSLGALLLISPLTLALELLLGSFFFAFTKNVYAAAISMIAAMPAILYFTGAGAASILFSLPLSLLMLLLHRKNMKELIAVLRKGGS
ncbi:MAG: glycerol-3-phosphate acyltransferase [Deltaproteobacteria bacterium]|nr:glycerol-3-phosphate acyltransferase [Deltaproteobacteria bacterium]